jgi:zinc protease
MTLASQASLTAGAPSNDAVFPYPIDQKEFPNGLRLVGVHFDSPGLVSYYTIVRVGSRHEVEPGHSGFAHFFEHMMFRGTERYDEEQYNDVLTSIGADSNANTSFDRTRYHILASSSALPKIVEIESDRFQHLQYNEEQFQKEAGAVLGEYNKNASSPLTALQVKLYETAFQVHPYRHLVIGFLEDIQAMPTMYDYSLSFFDRFYRPEYTTILVVGDFDWEELSRLVEEAYGDWKRGSYTVQIPSEPPQTEPKEVSVEWPSPTLPQYRERRDSHARYSLSDGLRGDLSPLSGARDRKAVGGLHWRGSVRPGRSHSLHDPHPRAPDRQIG